MHPTSFAKRTAILLFGMILILPGCFFSKTDTTLVDPVFTVETFEGTLYSLGNPSVAEEGSNTPTHLLGLEDGSMIYAYSESTSVKLEDISYKGVKVSVTGNLYPASEDSDKDTIGITSIELVTPGTTETSALVEMKTFRHSTLDFTISYRSDWEVQEGVVNGTGTAVTFTAPVPPAPETDLDTLDVTQGATPEVEESPRDTISIKVLENLQSLPVEEWYSIYSAFSSWGDAQTYTKSMVSKDQLPAVKSSTADANPVYYVAYGTTIFQISHSAVQTDYKLEYSTLFSDMLYSFDVHGVDEIVPTTETSINDSTAETSTDDTSTDTSTETTTTSTSTSASPEQQATINSLKTQLNSLVPDSGNWTPTRYSFAEPDYVYVEYQDSTTETKGRILVRELSTGSFEVLAVFKEGETTDWTLVSGTNEASGLSQTSINAESGQSYSIPEGYALFESSNLQFSMPYPSNWYYTRSGDSFYFSDKPADASNWLVNLTISSSSVASYNAYEAVVETQDIEHQTHYIIHAPRDDSSSYSFEGFLEYKAIMETMAQGLVSTES